MKNPVLLVTFTEVVNRTTMAAAARHLKLTPAAVSKHILALENELGVQLFKRSTRRVELTPEGIIYFEHAKLILEAYSQAEAAISNAKEEPSGILKIVCGPQVGYLHVLPNLKEFLARFPKLRLNVELTQTLPDLEKEKVDVVVGLTTGIPVNCIQRTLTYARWVFCASPEYLEKYGMPKHPSDLKDHKIITHSMRKPNNAITFKTGESIHFEPILYFNDTRAMRRSALHGTGIVQLHDYIVAKDLKEGKLIEILKKFTDQKQTIPIHISYLQTSHVHIKIRKFIDFMVEVLSRTGSQSPS